MKQLNEFLKFDQVGACSAILENQIDKCNQLGIYLIEFSEAIPNLETEIKCKCPDHGSAGVYCCIRCKMLWHSNMTLYHSKQDCDLNIVKEVTYS